MDKITGGSILFWFAAMLVISAVTLVVCLAVTRFWPGVRVVLRSGYRDPTAYDLGAPVVDPRKLGAGDWHGGSGDFRRSTPQASPGVGLLCPTGRAEPFPDFLGWSDRWAMRRLGRPTRRSWPITARLGTIRLAAW